jgi:hypothetical protein
LERLEERPQGPKRKEILSLLEKELHQSDQDEGLD